MTDEFWKAKLKAFLHDPPGKCFNIAEHEKVSASCMAAAGFTEEEIRGREEKEIDRMLGFSSQEANTEYLTKIQEEKEIDRMCDRAAAAADRFLFPSTRELKALFSGGENAPFLHPFCNRRFFSKPEIPSPEFAEKKFQAAIGVVAPTLDWKSKFLLYWRRWPEEASKSDSRLAFLPADTRIPDHTIWNHLGLTSAFRSCVENGKLAPAFLLFQLGPVQEFIECARSTQDCWSGSYILSWLMSKALSAVAMECGPDNVIFPALRGQPFFDFTMKDVYSSIGLDSGKTLWDYVSVSIDKKLRIPNIPNRFLMLVPQSKAKQLAELAENAIRSEWHKISSEAWKIFCEDAGEDLSLWKERWADQVENFLTIHWQTMDWDMDLQDHELTAWALQIPEKERDPRYFDSSSGTPHLSNPGNTWNLQYKRTAKAFAARRALRDFEQFTKDSNPVISGAPKDALSGIEEIIGSETLWTRFKKDDASSFFKKNEGPYGAVSIIKRLFPEYLKRNSAVNVSGTRILSTQEVAGKRRYFAILAMDGDEIGKRLSGDNAKRFLDSLASEARKYFEKLPAFQSYRRPMSPSAHAQFSECLSNFALHLAEPVVRAFDGQLIYAGGDDVLAMLPSENALAAAYMLRCMFRGEKTPLQRSVEEIKLAADRLTQEGFRFEQDGFISIPSGKEHLPLMVPGTESDLSCGIAVAHSSFPLQRAIHEARAAEKRAKREFGRAAFAMSLLKRSGEIIQWGSKWKSSAIELFYRYKAVRDNEHAVRLPYSFAKQVQPYMLDKKQSIPGHINIQKILLADFHEVCTRQWPDNPPLQLAERYLAELSEEYGNDGLANFSKLFLAVAFIYRNGENGKEKFQDGE